MSEPLVSCIIPCYNAAEFIERAVRSLLTQSYQNIEVICVNDGSQDDTETVLQYLATQDPRVKWVFQANQGVSAARNTGMAQAQGDFLVFCDADDWYVSDAVAQLVMAQQAQQADIVVAGMNFGRKDGRVTPRRLLAGLPSVATKEDILLRINMSSCSKLYRRALIEAYGLHYMPGLKLNEEYTFVLPALLLAKTVAVVQADLYVYYLNSASASQNADRMDFDEFELALDYLLQQIQGEVSQELIEIKVIESLLYGKILNLAKLGRTQAIKETIQQVEADYPHWMQNPYLSELGKPQRLFLWFVKHKQYAALRGLAWLHSKLTN